MNDLVLLTESDVEQKFIYPLLTKPYPLGLNYSDMDIRTKLDIRKIKIDKGTNSKIYFPDYMIVLDGIPVVIIEAKAPKTDLSDAIREARLYAIELNSQYPTKLNPCSKIVVSNGETTIAMNSDNEVYKIEFQKDNADISNPLYNEFLNFLKKETTEESAKIIIKSIRKEAKFTKPIFQLGGKIAQNESVGDNSFGVNLSLEYRYLFNPNSYEDRKLIVKNAYVPSKKKLRQVDQIDRIIRSSMKDNSSIHIQDTSNPKEILDLFNDKQKLKHEVCYLIGSVGSGKSTFTDYIREVAIPDDIKKEICWLNINLNNSPSEKNMIYDWVMVQIIDGIRNQSQIDIDEMATIEKIFALNISRFKKGPISLLSPDSKEYKLKLSDEYNRLLLDKPQYVRQLIDFLFNNRNKLLIVVLDNCDKRNRDAQLLMFEVANWMKTSFACMVILPLRDSTFDNYRKEKPLDTVIKDFVFRIDPPLLDKVLYERFRFFIREMSTDRRDFYYTCSNSIKINCKRSEVANYLQSILTSLFQNQFFKRLISGLAGRDIRKGLEIFLDFCKSGHICEDEIFRMIQSEGDYSLPNHIISRILLRGSRKYYNDEYSIVKNLFHSYQSDTFPNPYVRQAILIWLKNKYHILGPNGTKGFHRIVDLLHDLQSYGHNPCRVIEEIKILAKAACVVTEAPSDEILEDDLISIAPSGFVHLELMKNVDYLSAISEDTYFRNPEIAQKIADNLIGKKRSHMSRLASLENARELTQYMASYKDLVMQKPEFFLEENRIEKLDMVDEICEYLETKNDNEPIQDMNSLLVSYPIGSKYTGEIVSIQCYGLFLEFGLNGSALIHKSNLETMSLDDFELGDKVNFEIIDYNEEHKRFHAKINFDLCLNE